MLLSLILLFLMAFSLGYAVSSLTEQVTIKYKVKSAPGLKVDVEPKNLGDVDLGATKKATLTLVNTGNTPLKVKLDGKYDKEQIEYLKFSKDGFTLEPGEEEKVGVEIKFLEKASPGDGEITIIITGS